jgi:hypothetical protein
MPKAPGMVTHTCNPSYLGGRDLEHHGLSSVQAKVSETPLNTQVGHGGTFLLS